jgi:hypothetical protein
MNKKQERIQKRKAFFSLKTYLEKSAAKKLAKLQYRQEKREKKHEEEHKHDHHHDHEHITSEGETSENTDSGNVSE